MFHENVCLFNHCLKRIGKREFIVPSRHRVTLNQLVLLIEGIEHFKSEAHVSKRGIELHVDIAVWPQHVLRIGIRPHALADIQVGHRKSEPPPSRRCRNAAGEPWRIAYGLVVGVRVVGVRTVAVILKRERRDYRSRVSNLLYSFLRLCQK